MSIPIEDAFPRLVALALHPLVGARLALKLQGACQLLQTELYVRLSSRTIQCLSAWKG
jgi:hypothetical protein